MKPRRVTALGTFGTERCGLITQRSYRPNKTKRGVVHCHGLNGQAWHPINFSDPVLDEMSRRGHAVITPDLSSVSNWGNDASQSKLTDAINYLVGTAGAADGGVLLWCGSMGTLVGLNYLRGANASAIAGAAIGLPAVDLADLHDNFATRNLPGGDVSIEGAYGGTLAGYQAALPTHNPVQNEAAYQGSLAAKIKLWYSTDDPTVIPSVVTGFAAATGVQALSMGNQGGHVFGAAFAPAVCDFLESL